MKKKGRPTKYNKGYHPEKVYQLCLLGATEPEIASFFDVSEKTLHNWRRHPEFLQALKDGREGADQNVADRLYQKATGYSHGEDKIFLYKGEPVIVKTTKHYPPDTTAAIFWLKNRRPDLWRDKHNMEVSGPDGSPLQSEVKVTFVEPGDVEHDQPEDQQKA